MVGTARVELAYQRYQHCGLPLTYAPIMVRVVRFERTNSLAPKASGVTTPQYPQNIIAFI